MNRSHDDSDCRLPDRDEARLRRERSRLLEELTDATDRLRAEVAERKHAEAQHEQHREQLAKQVRERTEDWNAAQALAHRFEAQSKTLAEERERLAQAHAASQRLMEDLDAARQRLEHVNEGLRDSERQARSAQTETARLLAQAGRSRAALLSVLEDHRQAEAGLRASEERFRRAVVGSPFPVLLHAEGGKILQASDSWCEITGYSREELATVEDWIRRAYGEDQSRVQADIDRLYGLNQGGAEGDSAIRTRSGELRIWDISSAPLGRLPDGRSLVITMAMDVTERRRAEAEISRLNAELERRVVERTAELNAANKELEAFSYSVSHDLRAPLRAVDGFAGILAEEHAAALNPEGRRLLDVIRNEAGHMGQLIDDLLDFARTGRAEMRKGVIDMSALAREAFQDQARLYFERELELKMAPLPPAWGDPAMIRLVWVNLISNAIKFTKYRTRAVIEIGAAGEPTDDRWYYIKDNGAGFNMKYADKLFRVFQRLHDSATFEGTGVGLALAQRIILRHGGRIWAEGQVEAGAIFHFTLPQRKSDA